MDSTEPGPGEVLHIPLGLLRSAARDVGAVADEVGAARARPAVVYDAGPGQARVGGLVAGVDAALAGLADNLGDVSAALAATAEDLTDTDRQERVRLFESTMGYLHGRDPAGWPS